MRLLESMHAQRGLLLAILELCRTPRTFDEVDALVRDRGGAGVYGTDTLLRLLAGEGLAARVEAAGRAPAWSTTDDGLLELERDDPAGRFASALAEEGHSADEYRVVLDVCDTDEGATLAQVKEAFASLPAGDGAPRYPQHAIDRLHDCGALAWTARKTWRATDLGRRILGFLDEA